MSSRSLSTQLHALIEERHFALVDGLCFPTWGSLLIVRVKNSVRPSHLFDLNRDHDYLFELPCFGERDTQSLRRRFSFRHRDFRALPRANRNI